jgi:hypothetical protein
MNPGKITYALIHSPLVGPLTWRLVQEEMIKRNLEAVTPELHDSPETGQPFWQQEADSAVQWLSAVPRDRSIVLVAHSGAGALLPAIHHALDRDIHAYFFVDAGIPRHNFSRLDLMRLQNESWAEQFLKSLLRGELFPTWTEEDLKDVIPNQGLRSQMVAELNPRGFDFFNEPIPVSDSWPEAPCAFIKFSEPYDWDFKLARQMGWLVREMNEGHFHMLVDPVEVTDVILETMQELDEL